MKVIVDLENKVVSDLKGYYEVVGFTDTALLSIDSVVAYQNGLRLSKKEEAEIDKVYKKLFKKESK